MASMTHRVNLEEYWKLIKLWWDTEDEEVKNAAVHVRFKEYFPCQVPEEGDVAPDATLFDTSKRRTVCLSELWEDQPLLLIAGSSG